MYETSPWPSKKVSCRFCAGAPAHDRLMGRSEVGSNFIGVDEFGLEDLIKSLHT
jgi:hypothetical protein